MHNVCNSNGRLLSCFLLCQRKTFHSIDRQFYLTSDWIAIQYLIEKQSILSTVPSSLEVHDLALTPAMLLNKA
jgi:hypothetical protein